MPTPSLSRRAMSLRPSATLAVGAKAKALARQGADIVNFSLGEPDFDTPMAIRRAAVEALEAGQTHYMPTLGDPETRGVIAAKLERENGIRGLTSDHVAISAGAKHSLYVAFQCLLDGVGIEAPRHRGIEGESRQEGEADEVLLPVPAWVSYAPIAELAGGRVVPLPTTMASDFKITPEQLRGAITPRSRLLVLNSPSNPCGTMYTEAELRALAAVVAEAARGVAPELLIVTDEIYEKIVYGGAEHFSIGSIPEVAERTITINGMSKAFAMTGWRIGYAACPGEFGLRLVRAMDTLQGQMTNNIASFTYPAVRVALTRCGDEVERMRQAFARRAELIAGLAAEIPGMRYPRPRGAFYLFPDVSPYFGRRTAGGREIRAPLDFAESLLTEKHVAVVPGEDFGGAGANHVRISYACAERDIERGMGRLAAFVGSLT